MLAGLPVDCRIPANWSASVGKSKTIGSLGVHVEPTIRLSDQGTSEGAILSGLESPQLKTSGTPNPTKGVAS